MSLTLTARNSHDLTPLMINAFKSGSKQDSRNGGVTRLHGITSVELTHPLENVCFYAMRDANPFFHLIEAMAMLVPINSAEVLSFFAANMVNFSDDGITFNAFYGTRARQTWGDQLGAVAEILRNDRNTRRAVVNLWDPGDLTKTTKDMACNLCMIFSVNQETGCLDMTTFNRSNDAVWGYMTGANMVHFPFFLEFVARCVGIPTGSWFHASANMHIYDWNEKFDKLVNEVEEHEQNGGFDPYTKGSIERQPLFIHASERRIFEIELGSFFDEVRIAIDNFKSTTNPQRFEITRGRYSQFVSRTLAPMLNAFVAYKHGRRYNVPDRELHARVNNLLGPMPERSDWKLAAQLWMNRRLKITY